MNLKQYRFNKRLKETGKLSWSLLVWFSKLTLFMFFLITALLFWQNLLIQFANDYQNISKQIGEMILIVLISTILIGIDTIKNLKIKK